MATKLDAFLDTISSSEIIDKTQEAADKALTSFHFCQGSIKSRDEFEQLMADFYCNVESHILGLKKTRSTNLSMDWQRCSDLLSKKYGMRGGKAAFDIAISGVEGGLYGLLKFVAESLANQFAENWVKCRVSAFWDDLSSKERISVSAEYMQKFNHILPASIKDENPHLFAANFYKFLEYHPEMLKRLKNIR